MTLPSKELASVVLKKEVKVISKDPQFDSFLTVNRKETINIYEFIHLVKEWIQGKNYMLDISYLTNSVPRKVVLSFFGNIKKPCYVALDEIEAVIEAGEWILKEIE